MGKERSEDLDRTMFSAPDKEIERTMNEDKLRQWLNVLALLGMITANALANIIPFNGQTTGEISDRFDVYFVPAGYVFSIWGLIYVALLGFAVYQALPGQRENPRFREIGYLFVYSCIANGVWLLLWHYEFFMWTVIVMIVLLLLLITIYLRLEIGRARVPTPERWLAHAPFSIYLGWITVATIANITQYLDFLGWNGWGISGAVWAVIMLVAGVAITASMIATRGDTAFSLVIVWAYVGIAVKQAETPLVANTAWILAGIVLLLAAAGPFLRRGRDSLLPA